MTECYWTGRHRFLIAEVIVGKDKRCFILLVERLTESLESAVLTEVRRQKKAGRFGEAR